MKKAEKNCRRHTTVPHRRWCKRMAKRLRRRMEKADPENAPRAVRELTRGWSD